MRTPQSLRAKLDAYEALSADDSTAGKRRWRRWSAFATAAGSGLALATAADADIIYSGAKNLTVSPIKGATSTLAINIDGMGQSLIIGARRTSSEGGVAQGGAVAVGQLGGLHVFRTATNAGLAKLASGAKISGGETFGKFGLLRSFRGTIDGKVLVSSGIWPESQEGFAGFQFTEGAQIHFGWIRLEWRGSTSVELSGIPKSLTAIDWAYQSDPDTPILAGAGIPPSVPEPNTAMIAFLASGCVGVLALHQRRRRLAEPAQADADSADATEPQ